LTHSFESFLPETPKLSTWTDTGPSVPRKDVIGVVSSADMPVDPPIVLLRRLCRE